MTALFTDGFDHYAIADVTKKWTLSGGGVLSIQSGRRAGSNAIRFGSYSNWVMKLLAAAENALVMGAAFKINSLQFNSSQHIFTLATGGAWQCELRVNVFGQLEISRNGIVLATSGQALQVGSYNFVEFKVTIADSIAANSCIARVNNVNWLNLAAGTDVKGHASINTVDQVYLGAYNGGPNGGSYDFDDFYLLNQAGSVNNDFLGDIRVDPYYANGDGTYQQLTPSTGTTHYNLVDDPLLDVNDYVSSSVAGNKDTYTFGDMSHNPTSIFAVQLNLAALKDDAGARSIKSVTRSGGNDYNGNPVALGTGVLCYSELRETDPATSAAWTKAGFNAVEFGAEVV